MSRNVTLALGTIDSDGSDTTPVRVAKIPWALRVTVANANRHTAKSNFTIFDMVASSGNFNFSRKTIFPTRLPKVCWFRVVLVKHFFKIGSKSFTKPVLLKNSGRLHLRLDRFFRSQLPC